MLFDIRIVGEIASALAGNEKLLAALLILFYQYHIVRTLKKLHSTHKPGSAGADNDDITHKEEPVYFVTGYSRILFSSIKLISSEL